MACGMTPEIMKMMMEMQEKNDKSSAKHELESVQKEISKLQSKSNELPSHSPSDWTATYEKWDQWQDPDELAAQEEAARKRAENASKKTSCNHDHSAEQKMMDMTMRQKLDEATTFHQIGNAFFAEGQYTRAAFYYHRGLIFFEYMFPEDDEKQEEAEMDPLKLKLLLNSAACRLKTSGTSDQVLQLCAQALVIDSKCIKAHYRKAEAHRQRHEFDEATAAIKTALSLADSESVLKPLQKELATINTQELAYNRKTKLMGKQMFKPSVTQSRQPTLLRVNDDDNQKTGLETWRPIR